MTMTTLRVLRPKQVAIKLSIGRATLYRWIEQGILPAPIPYGPRAVGWLESDIDKIIEAKFAAAA